MLLCCVAPLVEHCGTWLRLLLALCWLVVNSGEVLLEFFSVGSGGVEVHRLAAVFWWCFPGLFIVVLVFVVWLAIVALPSRLRCIAWLPYVLVRFSRIVGCCPGMLMLCGRLFGLRSGDGSQNGALVVLVEVVFLFVLSFPDYASGTPCVLRVRSKLCAFFLYFSWLLGMVVLCHGLAAVLCTVVNFVAKVPPLELL
ncbi:hypothetical protein Taro_023891 [Colocasia esculenta]|uniref:Uncharacterized protein n=1 Tax=Colocasia esculenta TaxID=4460 RepID=A0A843V7R5_COLES|nr:hypothetical protein [Colocasia esculenta]